MWLHEVHPFFGPTIDLQTFLTGFSYLSLSNPGISSASRLIQLGVAGNNFLPKNHRDLQSNSEFAITYSPMSGFVSYRAVHAATYSIPCHRAPSKWSKGHMHESPHSYCGTLFEHVTVGQTVTNHELLLSTYFIRGLFSPFSPCGAGLAASRDSSSTANSFALSLKRHEPQPFSAKKVAVLKHLW